MLERLTLLPRILRAAVGAAGDSRIRVRASDDRFSLVEHAWHLADLEEEGFSVRIERLITENDPLLADFAGDVLAEQRRYIEQAIAPALERFARARTANINRLASLTPQQLERTGTQDGVGRITLARIPAMMLGHDRSHAHDLVELLRELGCEAPEDLKALEGTAE
jgi:hypothetical protein